MTSDTKTKLDTLKDAIDSLRNNSATPAQKALVEESALAYLNHLKIMATLDE